MEDDHRRGKEYYQVNLDMGRLFWIAFLIGIILISVFIFGFFIGGDRQNERNKLDLLQLSRTDLFRSERSTAEQRDELKILDLFDKDLEAETRYIDVESLEEAAQQSEADVKAPPVEPKPAEPAHEVSIVEKPAAGRPSVEKPAAESSPAPKQRKTYRPVGDYYIQVASFTQKANADRLAERLRRNMYRVEIETTLIDEKTFYRVRVGPFEERSVAVNTMTSMKRIFSLKDPFVTKKQS
jgi:cell division septation protein DedD